MQSKLEWAELKMAKDDEKSFKTPQKKEVINENSEIEVDHSSGSLVEATNLHIIAAEAQQIKPLIIDEIV